MLGLPVVVENLGKAYPGAQPVFTDFNLSLIAGSLNAVVGPSGVGKTTLLNCLSGLDRFQKGCIHVGSYRLDDASAATLSLFRRQHVGLTFQEARLLGEFTVLENVMLPMRLDNTLDEPWAMHLLDEVGCASLANRLPSQLSGGEAARVSLVRALIRKPSLWLLDEPTGNLDPQTSAKIIGFIQQLHRTLHPTTLIVTHNQALADGCDHKIILG